MCMGVVGDLVGRKRGLALTTFFTIFGVVGGAAFSWPGYGFWHIIVVCRFISGVGIGGIYRRQEEGGRHQPKARRRRSVPRK